MKQKTVTGTGNCLCPHTATQHRPLFSSMIEARKLTAGEALPQQKRRVTAPKGQLDEAGNPTERGCRENSRRDSKQTQCAAKPNAARCNRLCSALRWPMQRAAWAHAPHCGFRADVPHFSARPHLTEITAFLHTRCTLWQDSGRHAYERGFAPCISLRHTAPCPAPSLLGKVWRQHFCP